MNKVWLQEIGLGNNGDHCALVIHITDVLRLQLEFIEKTQYKQIESIFKALIPLLEAGYKIGFRHTLSETHLKDEKDHRDEILLLVGEPESDEIILDSKAIGRFIFPKVPKYIGQQIESIIRNLKIIYGNFVYF